MRVFFSVEEIIRERNVPLGKEEIHLNGFSQRKIYKDFVSERLEAINPLFNSFILH